MSFLLLHFSKRKHIFKLKLCFGFSSQCLLKTNLIDCIIYLKIFRFSVLSQINWSIPLLFILSLCSFIHDCVTESSFHHNGYSKE